MLNLKDDIAVKPERNNIRSRYIFLVVFLLTTLIAVKAAMVISPSLGEASKSGVKGLVNSVALAVGHDNGYAGGSIKDYITVDAIKRVPNKLFGGSDLETLYLDIKIENFKKIEQKRNNAVKRGFLVTQDDDEVSAKIRHKGNRYKVKVRLKGDMVDHLYGNKWSFRIKLKGRDRIGGFKTFSIQHPKTRAYQLEDMYFLMMQKMGVLVPRSKFYHVYLNGDDLGVMRAEEHFSKELLESQGRKESVIFKFNESKYWEHVETGNMINPFDTAYSAPIAAFQMSKINKNPALLKLFSYGHNAIDKMLTGDKMPSQIFDAKLMGAFLAVNKFWGGWHPQRWHNVRFYMNPYNLKLEPIAFDASLISRSGVGYTSVTQWASLLLSDPVILDEYYNALSQLKNAFAKGDMLNDLRGLEKDQLDSFYSEFFLAKPIKKAEMDQRIDGLKKYEIETSGLKAKLNVSAEGVMSLDLQSILPVGFNLESAWLINSKEHTIPLIDAPVEGKIYIKSRGYNRVAVKDVQPLLKKFKPTHLILRIKFFDDISADEVISPFVIDHEAGWDLPAFSFDDFLKNSKMVELEGKAVHFKKGDWNVDHSIIIPAGYDVVFNPGLKIFFAPRAFLLSHSAITSNGAKGAEVELNCRVVDKEKGCRWPGIFVMDAKRKSHLQFTKISNTFGLNTGALQLTGGVVFYKSDVALSDITINNSQGEDALNIVSSEFHIDNLQITDTFSDGFDADYSVGEIKNSHFKNIGLAGGGDAIDFSGSLISATALTFNNVSDKAISVGEATTFTGNNLIIQNVGTGIASKDGSKATLDTVTFKGSRVFDIAAYIKKKEYGPASVKVININKLFPVSKVVSQKGNFVSVENQEVENSDVDVDALYETTMKKARQ